MNNFCELHKINKKKYGMIKMIMLKLSILKFGNFISFA